MYPYKVGERSVRFNHDYNGTTAVVDVLVSDINYAVNEFEDKTITDRQKGRFVVYMGVSKLFKGDPKKGIRPDPMVKKTGRTLSMERIVGQYAYVKRGCLYTITTQSGHYLTLYARHGAEVAHLNSSYL
jgi:hypothetical protein